MRITRISPVALHSHGLNLSGWWVTFHPRLKALWCGDQARRYGNVVHDLFNLWDLDVEGGALGIPKEEEGKEARLRN
jgi:hypothetical protein